jgi:hypothetical protein
MHHVSQNMVHNRAHYLTTRPWPWCAHQIIMPYCPRVPRHPYHHGALASNHFAKVYHFMRSHSVFHYSTPSGAHTRASSLLPFNYVTASATHQSCPYNCANNIFTFAKRLLTTTMR